MQTRSRNDGCQIGEAEAPCAPRARHKFLRRRCGDRALPFLRSGCRCNRASLSLRRPGRLCNRARTGVVHPRPEAIPVTVVHGGHRHPRFFSAFFFRPDQNDTRAVGWLPAQRTMCAPPTRDWARRATASRAPLSLFQHAGVRPPRHTGLCRAALLDVPLRARRPSAQQVVREHEPNARSLVEGIDVSCLNLHTTDERLLAAITLAELASTPDCCTAVPSSRS